MNLFTKQKQTQRFRDRTYGDPGERIIREFGLYMYTLLYLKWITYKILLCTTGSSAQYSITT